MSDLSAHSGPHPRGVVGVVRSLQITNEVSGGGYYGPNQTSRPVTTKRVIDFRLEREGVPGVIAVRIEGYDLTSTLAEGDQVEVFGEVERGVLVAERILNRTTGAIIEEPHKKARMACGVVMIVWIALIFALVIGLMIFILTQAGGFFDGFSDGFSDGS